jgi:hypothetical protein
LIHTLWSYYDKHVLVHENSSSNYSTCCYAIFQKFKLDLAVSENYSLQYYSDSYLAQHIIIQHFNANDEFWLDCFLIAYLFNPKQKNVLDYQPLWMLSHHIHWKNFPLWLFSLHFTAIYSCSHFYFLIWFFMFHMPMLSNYSYFLYLKDYFLGFEYSPRSLYCIWQHLSNTAIPSPSSLSDISWISPYTYLQLMVLLSLSCLRGFRFLKFFASTILHLLLPHQNLIG